ncbi:MAG: HipA domain-containing protein [Bacteroidetes bacterium]|nr:HipA domain-containing protein [Bacteroidota bacterium]MBU1718353.1 HipA domain-containing protein [Bacteroidota bacterium]
MTELRYCPGTLAEGNASYSASCLKNLFDGRKVSHLLQYDPPQKNEEVNELFMENRRRISISGVQEKLSMVLEKNVLRLTREGEQGTHILKPIPRDLKKVDQVPANEHLTMQIARQVFRINTAENAMIFFKDGTPAYITKRFDIKEDKTKWGKEDFASLVGKTKDNAGPDFKYDSNYEEIGLLIQKFVPAWRIEIEKYFSLVLFNYLFCNGDAHLKNFSLLETPSGDHMLSPAYDLVNTRIHVDDTDFAFYHGLFSDGYKSESFQKKSHACGDDFSEFGKRIGVNETRIEKLMKPFMEKQTMVEMLTEKSFLKKPEKRAYLLLYSTRRNLLNA